MHVMQATNVMVFGVKKILTDQKTYKVSLLTVIKQQVIARISCVLAIA